MYIAPISSSKIPYYKSQSKPAVNFTAHPDFYKYNSTQSCFFRRGAVVLASKGYYDIYKTFNTIFGEGGDILRNMLIIGIGNSQETFSHCAAIKSILKGRKLNKNLDLYVVDLQSKPDGRTLFENSFYDAIYEDNIKPLYAIDSFVKDRKRPRNEQDCNVIEPILEYINNMPKVEPLYYRANDEILNFVSEAYNNPHKSKWDSRIQEAILGYPDNAFKIVSANNVLPYIIPDNEKIQTIRHIKRILMPGGYFITDPYDFPYFIKNAGVLDSLREIYKGIYQKIVTP